MVAAKGKSHLRIVEMLLGLKAYAWRQLRTKRREAATSNLSPQCPSHRIGLTVGEMTLGRRAQLRAETSRRFVPQVSPRCVASGLQHIAD